MAVGEGEEEWRFEGSLEGWVEDERWVKEGGASY